MTSSIFNRRAFNNLALGALAAGLAGRQAHAATYPNQPIEFIVPFAAGSGTDATARMVSKAASGILSANIVVENKAGASTVIGTEAVIAARPDGYTWLYGSNTLALNPTSQKSLPYDTLKDLTPVSPVSRQPFAFTISSTVKANTLQEFMALAKANPGKLVYGTAGRGSGNHLAGLLFAQMAGLDFNYVPFTDFGQRLSAEINGYVQVSMMPLAEAQSAIRSGSLRLLGIGDTNRDPSIPDVPTITEAGVPGYIASEWEGVLVRAGTPRAIVDQINGALGKAVKDPGLVKQFAANGVRPDHSSPEQFAKFIQEEIAKWRDVIIKGGLARLMEIRIERVALWSFWVGRCRLKVRPA